MGKADILRRLFTVVRSTIGKKAVLGAPAAKRIAADAAAQGPSVTGRVVSWLGRTAVGTVLYEGLSWGIEYGALNYEEVLSVLTEVAPEWFTNLLTDGDSPDGEDGENHVALNDDDIKKWMDAYRGRISAEGHISDEMLTAALIAATATFVAGFVIVRRRRRVKLPPTLALPPPGSTTSESHALTVWSPDRNKVTVTSRSRKIVSGVSAAAAAAAIIEETVRRTFFQDGAPVGPGVDGDPSGPIVAATPSQGGSRIERTEKAVAFLAQGADLKGHMALASARQTVVNSDEDGILRFPRGISAELEAVPARVVDYFVHSSEATRCAQWLNVSPERLARVLGHVFTRDGLRDVTGSK